MNNPFEMQIPGQIGYAPCYRQGYILKLPRSAAAHERSGEIVSRNGALHRYLHESVRHPIKR